MSNDWVGLDDDMGVSQQAGGDVQYVGVVETPDEPAVRVPRRPVQRVSPSARPVQNNGAIARGGMPSRGRQQEQMVYFPTESGAEVALNREATLNMARSKVHTVGGRTGLRIQPGQYLVIVPDSQMVEEAPRRARRRPVEELGTEDDFNSLLNTLATTGGGTARTGARSGVGTDWAAFAQGMVGSLATLGTGIATAVVGERQSQREADLARQRMVAETDAATAARQAAVAEQQRAHAENMARLRQQAAELRAVNASGGGVAPAPSVVSGGTSPIVWVVVAVAALGGIGGLVWFLGRKKSE